MRTVSLLIRMARLMPFIVVLIAVVACVSEENTPETVSPDSGTSSASQRAPAAVETIEIFRNDALPVEVSIVARGHFPNECTSVDQISQERRGSTFLITIDSVQYVEEACAANPVAFEESITLDLIGLPAGIYVVDVNGLQGTFKLQRDNIQDDGNAVVGGLVWHDRCDLSNSDSDEEIVVPNGCVDLGEGRYRGDGIRAADEPGIGGVKVHLGAAVCPSIGLATTLTAPDGTFLFSGLTAGDYCLTVASNDQTNSLLAGEGLWTSPVGAPGQLTVSLQPGGSDLDSAFGWTPVQTAAEPVFFATPAAECTNQALFIADVTIPDNTPFSPGEAFTKTWQLQNLGSCTWDPSYSLVFAAGERMGSPESVPITVTVPPGDIGELSIRFIAPDFPGDYRGEWQLAGPEGDFFGVGPGSDRPFWVQIIVTEEEAVG